MDDKHKHLIEESIVEDNFSSNTHNLGKNADDVVIDENFVIPNRYYKNKLVILAVNTQKCYVYWEFLDEFFIYDRTKLDELIIRVVDSNSNLLYEFKIRDNLGEYFVNDTYNNMRIHAEVGFYKENKEFVNLMSSKDVKTFSTQIKAPVDDVWISKQSGFTEIIRNSLNHFTIGMSSAQYAKEIKRLEEFSKYELFKSSSNELTKDNK